MIGHNHRIAHILAHMQPTLRFTPNRTTILSHHFSTCMMTQQQQQKQPNIYQQLQVQVLEPIGEHRSTLIWMHGLGDSSAGFSSMFEQMALKHTKIILPNAPMRPISVNGGYVMRGWYDIHSVGNNRLEQNEDRDGIQQSTRWIHELLDHEFEQSKRVVCGGFSQGGAMTLASALSYEKHAMEALIVASGYALVGQTVLSDAWYKRVQDQVPIYIFHGEMDDVVPYRYAMKTFGELMEKRGDTVQVFAEKYQGHEITDSEYHKLVELLTKHCSN